MSIQSSAKYLFLATIVEAGIVMFSLRLAVLWRPLVPDTAVSNALTDVSLPRFLYLILPLLWISSLFFVSIYNPRNTQRPVEDLVNVIVGASIATVFSAGFLYLTVRDVPRWLFLFFVFSSFSLLVLWRLLVRIVLTAFAPAPRTRRVLIVGDNETGKRVSRMIREHGSTAIEVFGFANINTDDTTDLMSPDSSVSSRLGEVPELVRRHAIDDVILALPEHAYHELNRLVVRLQRLAVEVRLVPDFFNLALFRAQAEDFGGLPLISLRSPVLNPAQRAIKRVFDILGAAFALIVVGPFMLLAAVMIWLDSPGPVFFRQSRVGENGRLFEMYKFRTMVEHAAEMQDAVNEVDEDGNLIHKHRDDPRVTRVGRLLRRYSLDEFPQLINVLRGEMSLVGPRPELPWLVVKYEPWQQQRFTVPQGITGWWQINGRSDRPLHLHTEDDLYYIQNYSFWMDLYILLKTPLVVVRGRGAY